MDLKVMFFVLNRIDKLDELLTEFTNHGIGGATVVNSKGMARLLNNSHDSDEIPFLGSVHAFLNPDRVKSNLIITVLHANQVKDAEEAIEAVVGDLRKPDTGVLFTMPVEYAKGFMKDGK